MYSLAPPHPASRPGKRQVPVVTVRSCPVGWVPGSAGSGLRWRNLLVTNDEFAAFLNEMAGEGLPNCLDGNYLLTIAMPHERGGRLHYNPHARRWAVSPGFGTHPAYWVTWTGAAAFAACHGARLPSRAEMTTETSREGLMVTSHGYQAGDTVPATQPGLGPDEIHHLVGNLQVWCCDGPDVPPAAPASRWLYGAAWNTPGTSEEIRRPRGRHLSGASRGVGIRLVRDHGGQPAMPAAHVASAVSAWLRSLADRNRPLRDLDEQLARELAALQADSGLRPHVGAGAGEPCGVHEPAEVQRRGVLPCGERDAAADTEPGEPRVVLRRPQRTRMRESAPWTLPCWRPSASTLTSSTSTTARTASRRPSSARPPQRGASAPSATRTGSTASRSPGS